jgi:hypothetical protein
MVIQCSSESESFIWIFFAYADNFPVHGLCYDGLDKVVYQIVEEDLNPSERGVLGQERTQLLPIDHFLILRFWSKLEDFVGVR